MKDLITIHTDSEAFPIDARELHDALGSKRQFGNWKEDKILSQFIEGQDFIINNRTVVNGESSDTGSCDSRILAKLGGNSQGGRPRKDYRLTIETAKHLCMMERTERGREIRQYFIGCEEALHSLREQSEKIAAESTPATILLEKMEQLRIEAPERVSLYEDMATLHRKLAAYDQPEQPATHYHPASAAPAREPAKNKSALPSCLTPELLKFLGTIAQMNPDDEPKHREMTAKRMWRLGKTQSVELPETSMRLGRALGAAAQLGILRVEKRLYIRVTNRRYNQARKWLVEQVSPIAAFLQ